MRFLLRLLKWVVIAVLALLIGGFLFLLLRLGPEPLTLAMAKGEPNGLEATPEITLPFDREAAWQNLQDEVFGTQLPLEGVEILSEMRDSYMGVQLINIELRATINSQLSSPFGISLLQRNTSDPLIVWSSFSPRGAAIPHPSVPGKPMDGMGAGVMEFVFGRYIQSPPLEMILDSGFAIAVLHPPEMVPDNAARGEAELIRLSETQTPRMGAILAWALTGQAALQALEQQNLSTRKIIAAGHSRYAKSALVWAAIDPKVDGVISHQSGTGGASLSRDKRGETVTQIMDSYPHWFAPGYAEDNLSIDQHHLLALIAPKPILLGGAKRDVWSDPNGALRAAIGADDAYYALHGHPPMSTKDLYEFNPQDRIALWTRPGTHGIVEEDWPAFLDFLSAHFGDESLDFQSRDN